MMRLHINVDHVATVRNARGTPYPDPVHAALICEHAGADGITMHLREDRRHIRDADVERARGMLKTILNLEMAATPEMIEMVRRIRPNVVTLVPERREEQTTEGGLNVRAQREMIERVREACGERGARLSLFIEPEIDQINASLEVGAHQVELHTGAYANLTGEGRARELSRIAEAAEFAAVSGLEVAAGHGLTQQNVVPIAAIPNMAEVNIGHAVISDAIAVGLAASVRGFRAALDRGILARR